MVTSDVTATAPTAVGPSPPRLSIVPTPDPLLVPRWVERLRRRRPDADPETVRGVVEALLTEGWIPPIEEAA